MGKLFFLYLVLSLLYMSFQNPSLAQSVDSLAWPKIHPPIALQKNHLRKMHDDPVKDEYYWMNDYFKKGPDSTVVVQYLEAENKYLDTMMQSTQELQQQLFSEMKARIKEQDESVPTFKNGYYYYSKTEKGKEYYKYCRKKGSLSAPEEVLLDVDQLAEGHPYYSATGFKMSPNNQLLLFGVDTVSRRQFVLHVKNINTGQITNLGIQHTSGNYEWANDNATFFYTLNHPETLLSEKIVRHRLGRPIAEDVVVYHEKDNTNYIGIKKTKAENFLIIYSGGTLSSELYLLEAGRPLAPFRIFQPRMNGVLYDVDADDQQFYIQTNKDALNFKLATSPFSKTSVENWKDLIAHRSDVLLQDITLMKDYIILSEKKDALDRIRILDKKNKTDRYLDFNEPVYVAFPNSNPEYLSRVLRYSYTSLTTPNSIYDYDLITGKKTLLKQTPVLGGYQPENYLSERVWATAQDGVKIPISLVYKKGLQKNGQAPLLLYGYGSYGMSMSPSFNSTRISLLDRGFVFAIAHIRGGQELGRQWYEDGKMMKKKNTFTDFIDCGGYLVQQHFTSPTHLYGHGGSAGGLLMGAVANMAPALFHGLIADVPFVDVVNTMLDTSIPLTTNEYDEWGNPNDAAAYAYIKSYSPYENIQPKNYPNLLVTTGLHDSQVQYFEPAKWVARLRALKTGHQVLLLKTNMNFGHGGASGRFDYLKDVALRYAFLLKLENKKN